MCHSTFCSCIECVWEDLQAIKEQHPIVHNITNLVVMEFSANALYAVGAKPIMSHAMEEVNETVGISKAVVINTGTLSPEWVGSMIQAIRTAHEKNIPCVLDPVGAGQTHFRTETALKLLQEPGITIVRGPPSEILALAGTSISEVGDVK
eukprot:Colp12_sorted_trinity150504_noHs@16083